MSDRYEFDGEMQTQILASLMKDDDFCRRTAGLVKPEYFENEAERVLANISIGFYEAQKETPSETTFKEILSRILRGGKIRSDLGVAVVHKFGEAFEKTTVKNRAWLMENIAEFAKQQAYSNAIIEASSGLSRTSDEGRFEKIDKILKAAAETALASHDEDTDYFAGIERRTQERLDIASGAKPKTGITTGISELDELLIHGGYGRSELSVWMGGAKSGKSFAIVQACGSAVLAGKNALHVSLENSKQICEMRYDAFFSKVGISNQLTRPHEMAAGVEAIAKKAGVGILRVREFPSGTFRPKDLRRLLDEYHSKGIKFDLIAIDYLDIMAPDHRTDSPIENSKQVWVNTRAIMQEECAAGVSATQTNRTGHKAVVARAEDVAEDFNKIRIADVVFSINRQDDEKHERKARIYLAAGRNQEDGRTLFVTQDLNIGRSVATVESVE